MPKPIIVGACMSNFKDSFALLSKVGACVQIRDGKRTDPGIPEDLQG